MKDAQGHGSEGSAADRERAKDAAFVANLRGWVSGDKAAAQALASQYGNKAVSVEIHPNSGGPSTPASTPVAAHAEALGKTSQSSFGLRGRDTPSTSKVDGSLKRQNIGMTSDAKFTRGDNAAPHYSPSGNTLVSQYRNKK